MSWTNKLPKTKGWKYWRKDEKSKYGIYEIIDNYGDGVDLSCHVDDGLDSLDSIGGEWWDSPVPEPMDSQKIKLELAGDVDNFVGNTLSRKSKGQLKFYIEQWKPRGE